MALVKTVSEASKERSAERSIGVPVTVPGLAARVDTAGTGVAETPSQ